MPFPVSRTLTFTIDASHTANDVLGNIADRLPGLGASDVQRVGDVLSFRVPWTTSYGPLFMVTRGDFSFQRGVSSATARVLRCHLSFRRATIAVILGVYGWLGVGASLLEGGYADGSLFGTFMICTVGWCFLLGPWYLIVPSWLTRRLDLLRFELPAAAPKP